MWILLLLFVSAELVPWNCSQVVSGDDSLLEPHPSLVSSVLEWETSVNCSLQMDGLIQATETSCILHVPYVNVQDYPVTLKQTFSFTREGDSVMLERPCLLDLELPSAIAYTCNATVSCERVGNFTTNGTHLFAGSTCLEPLLLPTESPVTFAPTPVPTLILTISTSNLHTTVALAIGLSTGIIFVVAIVGLIVMS
jgi:hypothetical protein